MKVDAYGSIAVTELKNFPTFARSAVRLRIESDDDRYADIREHPTLHQ